MFETNDHARMEPSPFFTPEEGTHAWAYISQTSNREWFYVTYETAVEEETSQQQFMVPMASYLFGLAARESPSEYIKGIQLVSPPWMNGSDSWIMEKLKTIWLSDNKYCYEMQCGKFYPAELDSSRARIFWAARYSDE